MGGSGGGLSLEQAFCKRCGSVVAPQWEKGLGQMEMGEDGGSPLENSDLKCIAWKQRGGERGRGNDADTERVH